jgi:GT2 family glycosyltransferase
MSTKISIIITTYQRFDFFVNLVQSILRTTPTDTYEIVVVSSDDPNSEKIKWLQKQKKAFKDIFTIIQPDVRVDKRLKSLYYYQNLGLKEAKYPWLLPLNDDTEMQEGWYEEFDKMIKNSVNDNLGMIIVASHTGSRELGYRTPILGHMIKHGELSPLYLSDVSIIRADVMKSVGYFDENLWWYGSGADLSLSIGFLTDSKTVANSNIKIEHYIADELRGENVACQRDGGGQDQIDFGYIHRKWDKWCQENNCSYLWL